MNMGKHNLNLTPMLLIAAAVKLIEWLAGGAEAGLVHADFGASAMIAAAIVAAIAGTATAAVGTANAIKAKKNKRATDRLYSGLNAENASNYYADYYRGALENDSTRAYLKRLDAAMKRNNRALDNTIVSTGATQENSLAQRQAKNAVMSDAMGQAVSAEDARRQGVRNNYFTRKSQLAMSKNKSDQAYSAQQQQNLSTIVSGVNQAASSFASLYAGGGSGATASSAAPAAASSAAPAIKENYSKALLDNQYSQLGSNFSNYSPSAQDTRYFRMRHATPESLSWDYYYN